ncbi:MAG: hypothetical protein ACR2P3_08830 [Geminicoccaceae bacterium]
MARIGERVIAVITPRSMDGLLTANARKPYAASRRDGTAAMLDDARFIAKILVAEGLELLNFHAVAISFAGTPEAFEMVFGFRPVRRTFAGGRGRQVDGFDVEPEDAHLLSALPSSFEGRAGFMAIARPPRLTDDAGTPVRDVAADLPVWLLPDELAISIWADGTGAPEATGQGVVAAQIGTGHYRHRFFSERGYRVLPTLLGPGQRHPQQDDHGHSTGEAACLFGAAPDLRLRPIKGLLDPVGDLLMAADSAPRPDLIINSWGYDVDQGGWNDLEQADPNLFRYLKILEAVIAFAAARGIVVCAAVPRTWRSFPACHPEVIAIAAASKERASRSVGASGLYPGRQVPDLWSDAAKSVRTGLDLIGCTHPAQPGSVLARPGLHETSADEGFAWCDIELAAAPLAASRLAVLLEQHRALSPTAIRAMVADIGEAPDAGALEPAGPDQTRGEVPASAMPKLTGEHIVHTGQPGMGSLAG